ncbi:MAG: DUF4062 domain-containing protein, partial [Planctomycetes bacterium]|nr:DUF4062 domain-containing protein [Planctomycetota bacterium]
MKTGLLDMKRRHHPEPEKFNGVMVSSTFKDLEEHRKKIIDAIERQGMKAIAMEYDSAKPDADIILSSIDMVDACAGFVGIIGYEYGQRPKCNYSATGIGCARSVRFEAYALFACDRRRGVRHRLRAGSDLDWRYFLL